MEFVIGDETGLCKELSWLSNETRRTRIIKKAKQSRSLGVTTLCWSGTPSGNEVSEIAVGRTCGSVEAFATSDVVCEAAVPATASLGESTLDEPLRSFQLPSAPVHISMISPEAVRAHTRSLLCKSWLGSGVTAGEASLRTALLSAATGDAASAAGDPSCSSSSRLLLAVGEEGHACVVEWEGIYNVRLVEKPNESAQQCAPEHEVVDREEMEVGVKFLPIGKKTNDGASPVQEAIVDTPSWCRAAYKLPGPIAAASTNPLCHSLLAFGGRENDAKVVDLDYGKLLWSAKNVKASFLGLRCQVAITQIDWLLPIHPMVIAVGTAKGALRFYDLRCQRRPVLEVCEATQERRPVTALCVRPTAEVLQTKTHMRVALARAAESSAVSVCRDVAMEGLSSKGFDKDGQFSKCKGPPEDQKGPSCDATTAADTAQEVLSRCSGKDTATVYYADSYGMIYGIRVQGGSALLRLADKTLPKYNPSSYRSLSDQPHAYHSAEVKRKLISAMLDKQRGKLTSRKNDHPVSAAACSDLQLAAVSVGGYKEAMGAIVGLGLDPAGEFLVAVGLGRYAYVFDAKSRKLREKVFLKQKLTCLLSGGGVGAGGVKRCTATKGSTHTKQESGSSSDLNSSGEEQGSECDSSLASEAATDDETESSRRPVEAAGEPCVLSTSSDDEQLRCTASGSQVHRRTQRSMPKKRKRSTHEGGAAR
ncbi:hypothetical protein, conserved [Eimeria necatrix]|uniref:Uncharacterized protein n=1 Tax=Eimeria necatrix TaxID=51315 RepID=U6N6X5_9EIME|nr:hypothetical protein, conserved [Eimeria necatrix]CDJ69646.1 hypothetical protein, conserved [Eimeria necatrix]